MLFISRSRLSLSMITEGLRHYLHLTDALSDICRVISAVFNVCLSGPVHRNSSIVKCPHIYRTGFIVNR